MESIPASTFASELPSQWAAWTKGVLTSLRENWDGEVSLRPIRVALKTGPDAFLQALESQGFIELFSRAGKFIINHSGLSGGPSATAVMAWNTETGEAIEEPFEHPELSTLL